MPTIKTQGKPWHIVRSFFSLLWIGTKVTIRHRLGKPLVKAWSADFEIGTLFWRGQFNHALSLSDIKQGRAYFDSLQTYTDEVYPVTCKSNGNQEPKGDWYIPNNNKSKRVLLFLHGGGYAFHGAISEHFAQMLAHEFSMPLFAPDYRLTPEHPHPAQLEDAIEAYEYLLGQGIEPNQLVVAGDSAGGHLALTLLLALKQKNLPQPALIIGMCPWTDIGKRGKSQFENDPYDLVQGYMTIKFGEWLKGNTGYSNEELSPINFDFSGLAPLYLQGGGKEVLIDMIRDFARLTHKQNVDVTLDVWEHMTHDFQAHGASHPDSTEALKRMKAAIIHYTAPKTRHTQLPPCGRTENF